MAIRRKPHNPMYRAVDAFTGEVLMRFRAKNLNEARAQAKKYLFLHIRAGGDYDLQRYEGLRWETK